MHINQLTPILQRHFRDDRLRKKSIFLEGASGIGKSDLVRQLRDSEGVELRDKRLSQMDAVDLTGTPGRDGKGYTNWAPPDWLFFEEGSKGILLLDEITSASREVFAASYQLFLDREINGAKIPDGWMVLACGNRVSDRGVINQMPSPLLNRFVKISVEPHLDSWVDWAGSHGLDERIIAWVLYQSQYLHNFNADGSAGSEPFCSPRSIASAADYLDWPDSERVELLRGCLGKEGASALESFLRLRDKIPTLQEILSDPLTCRVPGPDSLGERYAAAMMCSSKMDRTTFDPLWQYVDRMGSQFVVLAVKLALSRDKGLSIAKGYREFVSCHSAVFSRA